MYITKVHPKDGHIRDIVGILQVAVEDNDTLLFKSTTGGRDKCRTNRC